MSDLEDIKIKIELGVTSIGEWDLANCECDASVGMSPCRYCAAYVAIMAAKKLMGEYAKLCDEFERMKDVLKELVDVATLRGDNDLPHPSNDDKLWTARMQSAWDDVAAVLEKDGAS